MDTLLKKIAAVAAVNEEIIARVTAREESERYMYDVAYEPSKSQFEVAEIIADLKSTRRFSLSWTSGYWMKHSNT